MTKLDVLKRYNGSCALYYVLSPCDITRKHVAENVSRHCVTCRIGHNQVRAQHSGCFCESVHLE